MNVVWRNQSDLCRVTRRRALTLTFDDGPGVRLTPRVAEVLARAGVRATFFLLGRRAERDPASVEGIRDSGHELACHTHDHLSAWRVAPWRARADIDKGYQTLARWVPQDGLFRPPYGKTTPFTRYQIRRRGARIVLWTHDSHDTTHGDLPPPSQTIDAVVRDRGGVVLLHDFDRERDPAYNAARADYVLEVTEGLLKAARREGLRVLTAGELLGTSSRCAGRRPRPHKISTLWANTSRCRS
jgi:peptidoglycan/xylan/chitin deacetylase (PgdA/CDA1 family)